MHKNKYYFIYLKKKYAIRNFEISLLYLLSFVSFFLTSLTSFSYKPMNVKQLKRIKGYRRVKDSSITLIYCSRRDE